MSIIGKIIGALEALVHRIRDIPPAELAARLDALAADASEKLEWRTSIVDLLKLLGLPSTLKARKELATEFNPDMGREFNGDPEQNVWLHKQVLTEVANRGIKLPAAS